MSVSVVSKVFFFYINYFKTSIQQPALKDRIWERYGYFGIGGLSGFLIIFHVCDYSGITSRVQLYTNDNQYAWPVTWVFYCSLQYKQPWLMFLKLKNKQRGYQISKCYMDWQVAFTLLIVAIIYVTYYVTSVYFMYFVLKFQQFMILLNVTVC